MIQMKNYEFTFSVFTPTYNRGFLLHRVFESLNHQTIQNFEWIIVDDGSTDNTKQIIDDFKKNSKFPIVYHWKENGGKHTAINMGVKIARGYFFAIIDSDDWYNKTALEKMLQYWNTIEEEKKNDYCGVTGLFTYQDGSIVGKKFPSDIFDVRDIELIYVHKVHGDKIGINKTDVMKEFPFPEELGSFVTEALIWNRKGMKYLTRFVNESFAFKEYQKKGLSDNGLIHAIKSSRATVTVLKEVLQSGMKLPFSVLLKVNINYIRYAIHAQVNSNEMRIVINKKLFLLYFSIAFLIVIRDRFAIRKWRLSKTK